MSGPVAELRAVSKRFGEVEALRGFDLAVTAGETLAVLGSSASGKTTALRVLAGLETPDAGEVLIDGSPTREPPERRPVGIVFQGLALWPHQSVRAHLRLALGAGHGLGRSGRDEAIASAAARVGIGGRLDARPHELSGGERQRLAIARALMRRPRVLLLDEPCSHLDEPLRERTAAWLGGLAAEREGLAVVYVTHRREEAMSVADRLMVVSGGRSVRVGPPEEVFSDPRTRAVAELVCGAAVVPASALGLGGDGLVAVRPDQLAIAAADGADGPAGKLTRIDYRGDHRLATIELASGEHVRAVVPLGAKPGGVGDSLRLKLLGQPARVADE